MEAPSTLDQTISPFLRLLEDIARGGVDFAVVGGIAVCLNDYVRLTADADIVVSDQAGNVEKLLAVLRNWGEGWARELTPGDFIPQEGCVRISEEFNLDVFTRMRGKSLADFRPNLRFFTSRAGVKIPYLAPEDLIHCKQNSWRKKDQEDTRAMLVAIQRRNQPKQ